MVFLDIATESEEHGDILQEDFIDSYFNLTLKSMFTLKWVNQLISPLHPYNLTSNPNVTYKGYNITYLFKVDDDCYVNPEAILSYCRIMKRYPNAIVGHVLGAGSPAIRPHVICDNYNASTSPQYITKVLFKSCIHGKIHLCWNLRRFPYLDIIKKYRT